MLVYGGGIFHSGEGTRESAFTRVPSMFGRSAAKPKLCVPGGLVIGPLYDGVYWPGKVRPKRICSSGKSPGKKALAVLSGAALTTIAKEFASRTFTQGCPVQPI